jgi:hypothetical protein
MAFPVSPTEGQTFTENNTVWIYSAVTDQWNRSVINPLNETTYIGSDGAPGGIGGATQVIFNDNGSLASDAGLVYNKTTDVLTTGSLRTTSLGTAAAPGIAFASDPNTGIYLVFDPKRRATGLLNRLHHTFTFLLLKPCLLPPPQPGAFPKWNVKLLTGL